MLIAQAQPLNRIWKLIPNSHNHITQMLSMSMHAHLISGGGIDSDVEASWPHSFYNLWGTITTQDQTTCSTIFLHCPAQRVLCIFWQLIHLVQNQHWSQWQKQNTNSTSDVNSGPILHFQILFGVLFLLYGEDLTFETFVANNIKRSILSHLFDDQLHHISVLEACITRIKLNMVVARNCCQLQFNLASTNLQPKAFLWSVDLPLIFLNFT